MGIIILHDPLSAASRAFLDSLGVTIPKGEDVSVTIGTDTVRIVSDHAMAVAICPAFPGYPTAVVETDGVQRQIVQPSSWQAVTSWMSSPVPATPRATTMTKYAFSQRFMRDEMIGILAIRNTDPAIGLFLQLLDYAQEIDLLDTNIQSSIQYLVSLGKLSQDRAAKILAP